jgi:single-stranded-DNA-specific exonuclease
LKQDPQCRHVQAWALAAATQGSRHPQLWQLPPACGEDPLAGVPLPLPLRAVLARRGLNRAQVEDLLQMPPLPEATEHFPQLAVAVRRLRRACDGAEAVAICGDYDADGMTSTALLIRALRALGANPVAAIPSRMDDGYGLNPGMVERLHGEGIRLLVTVDNGVSAAEALTAAAQRGMEVILTDHHTLPSPPPEALALIHPATTPEASPYRGLAGVGLAYVLGHALAQAMGRLEAIETARDLFCVGTIADMAPLTGANRSWLRQGLATLHRSRCEGLRALQQLAGLEETPLRADAIGFQIAPRINAVGRLGDPRLVVELLTADDPEEAIELARQCDALNRQRRELCDAIEAEALALLDADGDSLAPFLLLAQGHWHHGVIGIVASRLMERFQRPVALLAGEGEGRLRASVRAPEGFAVDQALTTCAEHLERYGGHPAAGGFTVRAEAVHALHAQLNGLALAWQQSQPLGQPVRPEALLALNQIDRRFWQHLLALEPFGVGHRSPVFWARDCQVLEERRLRGGHLRLSLRQGEARCEGIAWRWESPGPVPERLDLAFRVGLNRWNGEERLQLEILGLRQHHPEIRLQRAKQTYVCRRCGEQQLELRNPSGDRIRAHRLPNGAIRSDDCRAEHAYVAGLLQDAAIGLGLYP